MSIELVLPFDFITEMATTADAPAAARRSAAHLVVIDNGKARAGEFLASVVDELRAQGVIATATTHVRPQGHAPVEGVELDNIVGHAELVLAGVGDCGGCTAGTVTDVIRCAERGVPSAVVVTTVFESLARSVLSQHPTTAVQLLVVDHPIWNRDESWFASTAASLAHRIQSLPNKQ